VMAAVLSVSASTRSRSSDSISASNSWRDMGRSDDQRAGMREHYRNIRRAATPGYHILGDRAQRDKPYSGV
jgi:hypothetical protein